VLDGASFVFCNTFMWFMSNVKHFFTNFYRKLLYIDEPPLTPCVLNSFFTGLKTEEHGVLGFAPYDKPGAFCGEYKGKYIWDEAIERGLKVKVLNVPCRASTVNIGVDLEGSHWLDLFMPPRDAFKQTVEKLHSIALKAAKDAWDLFVVWYPIPDQAHHNFFPVILSLEKLREAFKWYDMAFGYAKHLIEAAKPQAWLVLSDHGFASDFEKYYACGREQHIHVRDALVVSNVAELPSSPREVYYWIKRRLGLVNENERGLNARASRKSD